MKRVYVGASVVWLSVSLRTAASYLTKQSGQTETCESETETWMNKWVKVFRNELRSLSFGSTCSYEWLLHDIYHYSLS